MRENLIFSELSSQIMFLTDIPYSGISLLNIAEKRFKDYSFESMETLNGTGGETLVSKAQSIDLTV